MAILIEQKLMIRIQGGGQWQANIFLDMKFLMAKLP